MCQRRPLKDPQKITQMDFWFEKIQSGNPALLYVEPSSTMDISIH
jgi:hypothetical protein